MTEEEIQRLPPGMAYTACIFEALSPSAQERVRKRNRRRVKARLAKLNAEWSKRDRP